MNKVEVYKTKVEVYKQALLNVAKYIVSYNSSSEEHEEELAFDAFMASSVLAVAFGKSKEDVLSDYLKLVLPKGESLVEEVTLEKSEE